MKTVQIRQAKDGRRLYPQITPSFADYLLAMPRGSRIAFARDTRHFAPLGVPCSDPFERLPD